MTTTAGSKAIGRCIYCTYNTYAHTYFEGFLCWFAGADDNEAWSSHTAEALQVQAIQHRHGRHSIVLQSTSQLGEAKTGYDELHEDRTGPGHKKNDFNQWHLSRVKVLSRNHFVAYTLGACLYIF